MSATPTTPPSPAVRTVDGVDLPVPGTWAIDPGHAEVGFVGRHFLLTKVRGRFTDVRGDIVVGERPEDTTVDVTVAMASVTSGDGARDDHLRSADLFDVEHHPEARFRSTAVAWDGTTGRLTGDLTIRGVTRPVTLTVDYLGQVRDPWGNERIVFSAAGKVTRDDWGISWNQVLETGGLLVSRDIELAFELEAILQR
jgi:polyisoprenoid-binding protein YceI